MLETAEISGPEVEVLFSVDTCRIGGENYDRPTFFGRPFT
jgi:hypothetical protein